MMPKLIAMLKAKRYKVYNRPYQLNIIGVRSSETSSNHFDDEIHVLFLDKAAKWHHYVYPATTDPGTYWLLHPENVNGTAILPEGQYVDAYEIGKHKGQYDALIQAKPFTVIRDYSRTAVFDFNNGKEDTGIFGVNIHHSSFTGSSETVDKWSAGCQVFQNINDFNAFMKLAQIHRSLYGNKFTYTLIDLRMLKRFTRRVQLYATGAAMLIGGILYLCLRD